MRSPEELGDYLRQSLSEINKKVAQDKKNARTTRKAQRIGTERARREAEETRIRQEQERIALLKATNNQVKEVAEQLHIKKYLEELRSVIAPRKRVLTFRPKDGKLGYSLVYGSYLHDRKVGEKTIVRKTRMTREGPYKDMATRIIKALWPVKEVLGITVDSGGMGRIDNFEVYQWIPYKSGLNPVSLIDDGTDVKYAENLIKSESSDNEWVNLYSQEGLTTFTSVLADFGTKRLKELTR